MSQSLDIKSIIKKHKPMLRETSIKNYLLSVNKLKKLYEIDGYTDFVRKPKTIIKQLHKLKLSRNTEKNYTSAIINVVDALNREEIHGFCSKRYDNCLKCYRKHIFDLKGMIDAEQKERGGALTDREKKNYITFEDVEKVHKVYDAIVRQGDLLNMEKHTSLELDTLQKWVLTAMYAYLPPVRNEYSTLNVKNRVYVDDGKTRQWKWVDGNNASKDKNHLIFYGDTTDKDGNVVEGEGASEISGAIDINMNQYKTSKTHGSRTLRIYKTHNHCRYLEKGEGGTLDLPQKDVKHLHDVLTGWRKINPLAKHLFYNKKGKQMTRNDMTKYLYRTFKILFPNKNVSSNILRKSYHTSREKANPIKEEYKKSKLIAESMGHTIDEALNTYTKDESK
jgi:hypothetical protein